MRLLRHHLSVLLLTLTGTTVRVRVRVDLLLRIALNVDRHVQASSFGFILEHELRCFVSLLIHPLFGSSVLVSVHV